MPTSSQHALRVLAVPAFQNNYLWLVHDGVHAAVVDPGDAAPILAALAAHHLTLTAILLTHHHADHIGGVPALLATADVPVFGPRGDGIAAVTVPLGEGDCIDVPGLDLALRVFDVPGHTLGHIAYLRRTPAQPWLFCGDTLFAGGCGRLFEGTPAQLHDSLTRLAALPDDTLVYCAHEYTLANLAFAHAVEPGNTAIGARIEAENAKRARGLPTIPSTIGLEKATNPFLRATQSAIASELVDAGKLAPGAAPPAVFAALREWKNTF
ncbi:hydroxyacylglutathione hydrolase [Massilia sp. TWP1-3-3]|uniref:hydroxyacylglutathione hydrolase n=1 Tax=Massilia sp. TWP1-3-3 TaxID=2804573 RepID=UPI003CE96BAB